MSTFYTVDSERLSDIADAIRLKRDITDEMTLEDMPMQIGLIESGGSYEMTLPTRYTRKLWISNYCSDYGFIASCPAPLDEGGYVEMQFYFVHSGGGGNIAFDNSLGSTTNDNAYAFYNSKLYMDLKSSGNRIWSDTFTLNALTTLKIGNRFIEHVETGYRTNVSSIQDVGVTCMRLWTTGSYHAQYYTYIKSYDSNGVLRANLVPVADSITGKTGFFDSVSGMFYRAGSNGDAGLTGDEPPTV